MNLLFTVIGGKFKFQVLDSDLEYIILEIWRFEKHIALSEKKPPLLSIKLSEQIFWGNNNVQKLP